MSSRTELLDQLFRYGGGLVSTLTLPGRTTKAVERALAFLVRDGDVRAWPFLDRRKFYAPTPRAARKRDRDPRRYQRTPGPQAMVERLALAFFCRQTGFTALTRDEFAADYPEQARVPKVCHSRYYEDLTRDPPRLCTVLFDFGTGTRQICTRVRREFHERKGHQAFRDLIHHNLFQVTVATAFEFKAAAVRRRLAGERLLYDVVAVPDVESLLFPGE